MKRRSAEGCGGVEVWRCGGGAGVSWRFRKGRGVRGMLFGVGLGPGDPDLLTVRAVRVLKSADEVIVPGRIAKRLISGIREDARLVEFPMDGRRGEEVAHSLAAELAKRCVSENIAFCCLGDPAIYSTFQHVAEAVLRMNPAVHVEIVPGVSSFTAAFSRLKLFVDKPLLVATPSEQDAEFFAILKVKKPREVAKAVEERFGKTKFHLLERMFLSGERVSEGGAEALPERAEYLSILVGRRESRQKGEQEGRRCEAEELQNVKDGREKGGDEGERKVYFVGFGPGDPELLTLKGYELLKSADLIVYPGSLVSEEFLAAFNAEKVSSYGKRLEEIVEIVHRAVCEGKKVVRLQSGDPSIYGAVAEQKSELERRGIRCEIVPGVSSIFAAAAALGVELTAAAPSVVVTRPAGRTLKEDDLEKFASLNCTLVILLGVDKIQEIAERISRIRGSEEPAAVVFHASRTDEQVILGTLGDIAEKVRKAGIRRTAVILVGKSLRSFKRSLLYGGGREESAAGSSGSGVGNKCETAEEGEAKEKNQVLKTARVRVERIAVVGFEKDSRILDEISEFLRKGMPSARVERVVYRGKWAEFWANLWRNYDCIVAYMPAGAVVRAFAPLLRSKWTDPAVVIVDPARRHAIPILGGHHGGNEVAKTLEQLGLEAVLTTAAEFSDGLTVGIGCRKGVSAEEVLSAIQKALAELGASLSEVRVLATAELKRGESGILEAAERLKKPLLFAKAEEINATTVKPSEAERVGLRSVAEACAVIFSKERRILLPKRAYGNVTIAIAK